MQFGWIKLFRSIQNGWIWNDSEPFDRRSAWIDLLLMVNYEQKSLIFNDAVITVEPGQTITSIRKLADRWRWSKDKVSRFLDRLEQNEMITRESSKNCTLITICNYRKHQEQRDTNEDTNKDTNRDTGRDSSRTPQSLDFTMIARDYPDTNRDTNQDTKHDSDEDTNKAQCKKKEERNYNSSMQCNAVNVEYPVIILQDGESFAINSDIVEKYSRLYPGLNVPHEFELMNDWCKRNPTRRKKRVDMENFINSWLRRASTPKRKDLEDEQNAATKDNGYYSLTAW